MTDNNTNKNEERKELFETIKLQTNNFEATGASAVLVGSTNSGKSFVSNSFAREEVIESILYRREGDGYSSLTDTYIHPTTLIKDNSLLMVMDFKQNTNRDDYYRKFILKCLYKNGDVIIKKINSNTIDNKELEQEFKKLISNQIKNEFMKGDNTSIAHVLLFCKNKNIDEISLDIAEILTQIPIEQLLEIIRNAKSVAKKGKEEETVTASLSESIDNKWTKQANEFWQYINNLYEEAKNNALSNVSYDEDSNSLYVWIDENSSDNIKNLFLDSKKQSLEFLFDKMHLYYGISEEMQQYINTMYQGDALKNRYGEIFFTIKDLRGLFHVSDNEDSGIAEAKNYIYRSNCNLVLYFISAEREEHSTSSLRVLRTLKEEIKRDVEVMVILPKADKLVNQIANKTKSRSRFSVANIGINSSMAKSSVEDRIKEIQNEIDSVIISSKRSPIIREIVSYGLPSDSFTDEAIEEFNLLKVCKSILNNLAEITLEKARKIHVQLNKDVDDISFVVSNQFNNQIKNTILSNSVFKTSIYSPVMRNIYENKDKNGHGQSVKSVINNSQNGEGHKGDIDENWFVNVESIDIQFPVTLRGIVKCAQSVFTNVNIKNGVFVSERDKEEFMRLLSLAFSPAGCYGIGNAGRLISRELFYEDHIVLELRKGFFSYGAFLRRVLNQCYNDYALWMVGNIDEIEKAYEKVLVKICNVIRDKYIVYDR